MKTEEILTHIEAHLKEEWTNVPAISSVAETTGENLTDLTDDGTKETEGINGTKESKNSTKLKLLLEECRKCELCELYKDALNLVFGEGDPDSGIVFIGEAPGADEDRLARPFVGRAGKLLTKVLNSLGVERHEVFICNILKHRPPNNRNPLPEEIEACTPFLEKQLAIINPKVIITLGNYSTKFILKTTVGITKLRGTLHKSPLGINALPTFHPAAVLRNPNLMKELTSDIQMAINICKGE